MAYFGNLDTRWPEKRIGFALTGSSCISSTIFPELANLLKTGADIVPIVSEFVASTDISYGKAAEILKKISDMCGRKAIKTILEAEVLGPKSPVDALIIAPCTGNTLGKIANGISDACVPFAAKACLRNGHPVILAISTNDGLSGNFENLAKLFNRKNVYFVPFG